MLAKMPFRSKLILVVSVPVIALLVFAGITIDNSFQDLDSQQQYGEVIGTVNALTAVAVTAGDEGIMSQAYILDPATYAKDLHGARAKTSAAAGRLRQVAGDVDGRVSPSTARAVRRAVDRLRVLGPYRTAVDSHVQLIGVITGVSDLSADAAGDIARDLNDGELSRGLSAVLEIRRRELAIGDDALAILYSYRYAVVAPVGGPALTATQQRRIASLGEQQAAARTFDAIASPTQRAALNRVITAGFISKLPPNPVPTETVNEVRLTQAPSVPVASVLAWSQRSQALLGAGARRVQLEVNAAAVANESAARNTALLVSLGTGAVILLVLLLAWLLVRTINRPLRALTRSARDLSERRLPRLVDTLHQGGELTEDALAGLTPIRVDAEDELGGLARAFNTIQDVTVTVAREQSALLKKGIGDLYVNLARRNQSLLDRQLSLLDDLESSADPEELAALFELDHLATRMRRNAESLLVLSGAEQPRQWGSAVTVVDVVRAAAAEIADFARITAIGFEDSVAVTGNAVADLTHLLAELLENAAAFSPPKTPVVVGGRSVDERFVITIADEGIGMDEDRLAVANAVLARPPAPGLTLSRTLGLHVVAHLSVRHGVLVQLRPAQGYGMVAVIVLPPTILVRASSPDGDATTAESAPAEAGPPVVAEIVDDEVPREPEPASPESQPAPAAATAEPEPVGAPSGGLPRRGTAGRPRGPETGGNGNGNATNGNGLASRVPGTHLTHDPKGAAASSGELRPNPERVHDLLSRHERGKRDGQRRSE
jgi:signal transduction histidine kinase